MEDDNELAARIGRGLTQAGFVVRRAVDGAQGLQPKVEVIVLDLDLRGRPGLDILKAWRAGLDTAGGLNESVDDYLAKPFDLPELVARLHALRSRGWRHASNLLRREDLTVNSATGEVLRGREPIELTAFELRMLKYFMTRTRHVISQGELVEHL